MQRKEDKQIRLEFRLRQSRQHLAIAVTLLLLLLLIFLYKRNDIFGPISKSTVVASQAAVFTAFIVFSFFNWRCPSCNNYLGQNIAKCVCKKCRARLQ